MYINEVIQKLKDEIGVETTRGNIRFYEREGIISPQRSPKNNYRVYSHKDYVKIKLTIGLASLKFGLDYIKRILKRKDLSHVKRVLKDVETRRKVFKMIKEELSGTENTQKA